VSVVRCWDVGGRSARVISRPGRAQEIVVASVLDPFTGVEPGPTSGVFTFEVWNLDPRAKLVVTAFFRPSAWLEGDLAAELQDDPRSGWARAELSLQVMRRDSSGRKHVIGTVPDDVCLNAGVIPDGAEIVTGADGVRVVIDCALDEAATFESFARRDLVCAFEVVPNERLGCSGLADEIIGALEFDSSGPLALSTGWVGAE